MLFPTPVGKSYKCSEDIVIEMKDENLLAKISLRQLKMQPFIFKKDDFGPGEVSIILIKEHECIWNCLTDNSQASLIRLFVCFKQFSEFVCSPGGAKSYRDETAPIAVGSTLAVITLLTVAGYGVYRYMKVKKVQYDAME